MAMVRARVPQALPISAEWIQCVGEGQFLPTTIVVAEAAGHPGLMASPGALRQSRWATMRETD